MGVRSPRENVYVNAVCAGPTVTSVFMSSDVQAGLSGCLFPKYGSHNILNAEILMLTEFNIAAEISNMGDVHPMKVETSVLLNGAIYENAGNFVPVFKFIRKIFESGETIANIDPTTKSPHPQWEVKDELDEKEQDLYCSGRLRFDQGCAHRYIHLMIKDKVRSNETLFVDDGFRQR